MSLRNSDDPLQARVLDAIREQFERIYPRFAHLPNASVTEINQRRASYLSEAAAVRGGIVDYVESLYSALRFSLSAWAGINKLPDEILVHIMSTMSLPELVTATHVCHRWRKLGVETPMLWTRLTITNSLGDDSGVLLSRSKAASIDLDVSMSNHFLCPTRQLNDRDILVPPVMNRVRSLTLRSESESDMVQRWVYPARHNETLHMAPYPAPMLTVLRLDRVYPGVSLPFDCSSLQEAYIIRGMLNVDFLRPCSQLRILVLHVPTSVTAAKVLRVLRANSGLRIIELHLPRQWADALHPPDDEYTGDAPPTFHEIEQLSIHVEPATVLNGAWSDTILLLTSQFDCSRIPIVEVPCGFRYADDPVGDPLLGHLQEVTSVVLGPDSLRLQDTRGYVRCFTGVTPSRALWPAVPFLAQVRALDTFLSAWSDITANNVTDLPYLEELTLRGALKEFATMEAGAACPALRDLTAVQSCYDNGTRQLDGDQGNFAAVAMAVPRRIHSCPSLQLFTIIRESLADSEPLEDQTLHFDPPSPRTVFVTSAPLFVKESPTTFPSLSWNGVLLGAMSQKQLSSGQGLAYLTEWVRIRMDQDP
ncbi:hypothetical protein AURDEDRAFT_137958 [Auricularia subglabra TFB-10046 SS5]|nr:hypothetical protein AURDEDRAFT_137958 [Auricularia subglabra TFB-10046 SS5]